MSSTENPPRLCATCPTDISDKHSTAIYCNNCREQKNKEIAKESARKARGYYDKKICQHCGEVWQRGKDDVIRWTGVCSRCREKNYHKRRRCVDCDEFLPVGTKRQRCDSCKIIHRKAYYANWREKKKAS